MIRDSGERKQFESGAVRDIQEGKGRCDLLPLETIAYILLDNNVGYINSFVKSGDIEHLDRVFRAFAKERYGSLETAILELSKHYEEGAKKYGEHNWEKGIPLHCFINSAVRHYLKYRRGDTDESHDRAFLWNLVGAMWTATHHPELNDICPKEENEADCEQE